MKKVINWILNILIIVIICFIGYLLWQNYLMKKEESINTEQAMSSFDALTCSNDTVFADSSNPQVTNGDVLPNEIIGYITFPSLGTSTALLQGDISDDQIEAMERGVSHDPRSTMPGEIGNTVFAGHRELFFKNFLKLEQGDSVIINIGNNIYIYQIEIIEIINPDDVDAVFYSSEEDLLVMYTCYPIESWKPFDRRMVMKAKPISQTQVPNCSIN